jgi:putative membrane protein
MQMKPSRWMIAAAALSVTPSAWGQTPNDAQIVATVLSANHSDIHAGQVAESMGSNARVKAFGQTMVRDHSGLSKVTIRLATKLDVTPQDNPSAQGIKSNETKNVNRLQQLKGAAFDTAYINHEVAYHERFIGLLDKTLIPSAQNQALKTLLVQARPMFEAHLALGKQIQASLEQ